MSFVNWSPWNSTVFLGHKFYGLNRHPGLILFLRIDILKNISKKDIERYLKITNILWIRNKPYGLESIKYRMSR
jgi:hypothetical protein